MVIVLSYIKFLVSLWIEQDIWEELIWASGTEEVRFKSASPWGGMVVVDKLHQLDKMLNKERTQVLD